MKRGNISIDSYENRKNRVNIEMDVVQQLRH